MGSKAFSELEGDGSPFVISRPGTLILVAFVFAFIALCSVTLTAIASKLATGLGSFLKFLDSLVSGLILGSLFVACAIVFLVLSADRIGNFWLWPYLLILLLWLGSAFGIL